MITAYSGNRRAALAVPFGYALLLPLLPLLIELAAVLPRGIAVVGRAFALGLAVSVTVLVAVGLYGSLRTWGVRGFVSSPLAWALGALIVTESLAGIAGLSWRASTFEVLCQIGDALGFTVCWLTLRDDVARRTFLALFFASGIIACCFAIGITLSRHPPAAFAYEHGRAAGTLLQPNEFAGYLLFLVPLGLAQWSAPSWLRRVGLVAGAIGTAALAMSASRAAILGLLLSLPIIVRKFGRPALAGYSTAAAIALALGLTVLRNVAHDPSENASRIAVWRGAVRMTERLVLTGVGPLAFSMAYRYYKMPDVQVDEVHAHDFPLNVLIENGLLGFGALVFAVTSSVRAARTAGSRIAPSDKERGLLYAALCTSFVASAVQNSVDLVTTFVFLMWWPMLGLMLGMSRDDPIPV
jgi:hypothetical protein